MFMFELCPYRAIKALPAPRLPLPSTNFWNFSIWDNDCLIAHSPVKLPNRKHGIRLSGSSLQTAIRYQNWRAATSFHPNASGRLSMVGANDPVHLCRDYMIPELLWDLNWTDADLISTDDLHLSILD